MAKPTGRVIYGVMQADKQTYRAKLVLDERTVYAKELPAEAPTSFDFRGGDGKGHDTLGFQLVAWPDANN